jgi:putative ABC transport system permease protein
VFRTALKSLFARKFRLLTTGIAIVLGVAFVAGTMTLTDTISRTFDGLFSEVFAGTDGMVRAEEPFEVDNGAGSTRPRVDASLVEAIAAVPGVAYAEGDTFQWARIVGKDGETLGQSQGPPTFGGGWSSNDELNTWDLVEGRAPRTATEIVIDRGSADDGDLAPGDRTQVLTRAGPIDVTVVGVARFGDYDSPGGTTFAGFTPAAAQQYLGEPGSSTASASSPRTGCRRPSCARASPLCSPTASRRSRVSSSSRRTERTSSSSSTSSATRCSPSP